MKNWIPLKAEQCFLIKMIVWWVLNFLEYLRGQHRKSCPRSNFKQHEQNVIKEVAVNKWTIKETKTP